MSSNKREFLLFNKTQQGSEHINKGKVCQDASLSAEIFPSGGIIVVCDGHGGDNYTRSDIGSELAALITKRNIQKFVELFNRKQIEADVEGVLRNLEQNIITEWNEKVQEHYGEHPITEEEDILISESLKGKLPQKKNINKMYGTTLIACAITKDYWFGIQIGDGLCVALTDRGDFSQPIPHDEKCEMNLTTSLCENNPINNFRHCYSTEIPTAIYIGTDGVDSSFNGDESIYDFYKALSFLFLTKDYESAIVDIKGYLPSLSKKGSGDDISISGIVNKQNLSSIKSIVNINQSNEELEEESNSQEEIINQDDLSKRYSNDDQNYLKEHDEKIKPNKKKKDNKTRNIIIGIAIFVILMVAAFFVIVMTSGDDEQKEEDTINDEMLQPDE